MFGLLAFLAFSPFFVIMFDAPGATKALWPKVIVGLMVIIPVLSLIIPPVVAWRRYRAGHPEAALSAALFPWSFVFWPVTVGWWCWTRFGRRDPAG